MPPARTKPAASAPAATTGSFALSFSVTSMFPRRESTACASCSRSDSISLRISLGLRWSVGMGLDHLRRPLRLLDRLLGNRGRALLERRERASGEAEREQERPSGHDQDCGPGGDDERERGGDAREREAEREEQEEDRAGAETDRESERLRLAAELGGRELDLEAGERARGLGDLLDCRPV